MTASLPAWLHLGADLHYADGATIGTVTEITDKSVSVRWEYDRRVVSLPSMVTTICRYDMDYFFLAVENGYWTVGESNFL